MLGSWLLGPVYLVALIVVLAVAWLMGWPAGRYGDGQLRNSGGGLFAFAVRLSLGLALISWAGAICGVLGVFQPLPVLALLVLLVVVPWIWQRRHVAGG